MNINNNPIESRNRPDLEARDTQRIATEETLQTRNAMKQFNLNARQIKFGTPYTMNDLEVIFDVRFGEKLRNALTRKFDFIVAKNGTITFSKIR